MIYGTFCGNVCRAMASAAPMPRIARALWSHPGAVRARGATQAGPRVSSGGMQKHIDIGVVGHERRRLGGRRLDCRQIQRHVRMAPYLDDISLQARPVPLPPHHQCHAPRITHFSIAPTTLAACRSCPIAAIHRSAQSTSGCSQTAVAVRHGGRLSRCLRLAVQCEPGGTA